MSIENQIDALDSRIAQLTGAIVNLIAALAANPTAAPARATKARAAAAESTPPATTTAQATATPVSQAATQPPAQNVAVASVATGAATAPSAQDTGALMVRVANEISRDAAVALLRKYGAEGFGGVKPESYASFAADCLAALAANAQPKTGAAGLL